MTLIRVLLLGHLRKCCASFNRSLILPTWFIHVVTSDITTLINLTAQHTGHPYAWAGLTNLNTIFHQNNLALMRGQAKHRESLLEEHVHACFVSFTLVTETFCSI